MPELTNDIINTEIQETDKTDSVGYTYILHRTDNPGLVKVGFTAVSSQSRAGNYTDGEWQVHKEFPMPIWLARLTERASHRHLKSYWLDPKITGGTASEIFMCPLDIAVSAVELAFLEELEQVLKLQNQLILQKSNTITNTIKSESNIIDKECNIDSATITLYNSMVTNALTPPTGVNKK